MAATKNTPAYSEPELAEDAFYTAFSGLDIAQMHSVWSDKDEVSCIHPGGTLLLGRDAVLTSWAEIFQAHRPPKVSYRLLQVNRDRNLVIHTVEERVQTGDNGRQALVLATNIYTRTNDGWRMLAHHASLPLVEHEPSPPLH